MITPGSEAELAAILAQQSQPICIVGGGTRSDFENSAPEADFICTSAMTGIELYEPDALTIIAAAGTPLVEVEATLAAQGQQLPFEPMDHRELLGTKGTSTIGGVVAANISGPRRIQAGACRDSLIGVRFVDGTGNIIKNGGRVMKNVTGYDLVKLMAGSMGSLGVLTQVAFKVLPAPQSQATLVLSGVPIGDAAAQLARAFGSPNDVSGGAYYAGEVFIRVEGLEGSVDARIKALSSIYDTHPLRVVSRPSENKKLWQEIGNASVIAAQSGDIWRLSVKPSEGPKIAAKFDPKNTLLDWAGGLIWIATEPGFDMRGAMNGMGGHATLVRGTGQVKNHPQDPITARINAGLRAQFDPNNILNQGGQI